MSCLGFRVDACRHYPILKQIVMLHNLCEVTITIADDNALRGHDMKAEAYF